MKSLCIFSLCVLFYSLISYARPCPKGTIFVRLHYKKDSRNKTFKVRAHCRGRNKADEVWGNAFRDGHPKDWPLKEKFKNWKPEEKEVLLLALSQVHEIFFKLSELLFYRGESSVLGKNPASTEANKSLVVYNLAFEMELKRILEHELAHSLFETLEEIIKQSFYNVSGWKKISVGNETVYLFTPTEKILLDDSEDSPHEHFANIIELFLNDKNNLKNKNPKQFQWIKENIFGEKK